MDTRVQQIQRVGEVGDFPSLESRVERFLLNPEQTPECLLIMAEIEFTKEEMNSIVSKIKGYFEAELDQDIGQFDAEFLLEFFVKEIGPYFYNKGLFDARVVLQSNLDNIDEGLYAIEKPTEFSK